MIFQDARLSIRNPGQLLSEHRIFQPNGLQNLHLSRVKIRPLITQPGVDSAAMFSWHVQQFTSCIITNHDTQLAIPYQLTYHLVASDLPIFSIRSFCKATLPKNGDRKKIIYQSATSLFHRAFRGSGGSSRAGTCWGFYRNLSGRRSTVSIGLQIPNTFKPKIIHYTAVTSKKNMKKP